MELPLTTINTYPVELFKTDKIKTLVDNKRCFIILGEPSSSNLIDVDKIVGVVNELKEDKEDLIVDFNVLKTPMGTLFQTLFDNNAKIALRPCGVGQVDLNNNVTEYTLNYFWIDAT